MANDNNPWDPETVVSLPKPPSTATAKVQFEHDGVLFATAECWDGDFIGYPPVAYFVQDQIPWVDWHRISQADYEMIVARCKADKTSQLVVASCTRHHLTFVFRPAGVDLREYRHDPLVDPHEDEEHVTVIKAEILEHREPRRAEPQGDPWADIEASVFEYVPPRREQASA